MYLTKFVLSRSDIFSQVSLTYCILVFVVDIPAFIQLHYIATQLHFSMMVSVRTGCVVCLFVMLLNICHLLVGLGLWLDMKSLLLLKKGPPLRG